jgi:hypothetical protein
LQRAARRATPKSRILRIHHGRFLREAPVENVKKVTFTNPLTRKKHSKEKRTKETRAKETRAKETPAVEARTEDTSTKEPISSQDLSSTSLSLRDGVERLSLAVKTKCR